MPVGSKIQPHNIGHFNGAAGLFIDVKDIVLSSSSFNWLLKAVRIGFTTNAESTAA